MTTVSGFSYGLNTAHTTEIILKSVHEHQIKIFARKFFGQKASDKKLQTKNFPKTRKRIFYSDPISNIDQIIRS